MIVLRNKSFSEKKTKEEIRKDAKRKINTAKGVGTGILVGAPSALVGSIIAIHDSEKFDEKNRKRIDNVSEKYSKHYRDKYEEWLDKINKRSKDIDTKIDNYSTGDPLDDFFYKFDSKINLAKARIKLRNEAHSRYSDNMKRINDRVNKMREIARKASDKRASRNAKIAAISSLGIGIGTGLARKKYLDKKQGV